MTKDKQIKEKKEPKIKEYQNYDTTDKTMYRVSYENNKDGDFLSFQRIYNDTMATIVLIMKEVEKFYMPYEDKRKLHKTELFNLVNAEHKIVSDVTLSKLLIIMACVKVVQTKTSDRWRNIREEPYIYIQQIPKYVDKKYLMQTPTPRTPLYIYPHKKQYTMTEAEREKYEIKKWNEKAKKKKI